jgi:hypothetical protein
MASDPEVLEGDIEKVWINLMLYLCPMHRSNARNGRPTDFKIEELREDRYSAFTESKHFEKIINALAKRRREIEIEGGIVRLTPYGLDNCRKYDPTFQRDF